MKWVCGLIIISMILIAGCGSSIYEPKADISIEPAKITLKSGETSEPITVSITKKDKGSTPTAFEITLETPNPDMLQFKRDNTTITSIQTGILKRKGDRLSDVFTILATKAEGSDNTAFTATLNLIYNNTSVVV